MNLPTTITILVENSVQRPRLLAEHGLAFWLCRGNQRVLFDTGQSSLLIRNAQELGLDIATVDTIALSHGHYDHCGGLPELLRAAPGGAVVFAHPMALLPKYHVKGTGLREIGVPAAARDVLRSPRTSLRPVICPTEIAPGLFLTGEIPRTHSEEDCDEGFRRDDTGQERDPLLDDQALFLKTATGTVVFLGCAHAGVINTLDHIRQLTGGQPIRALLGGMHLHSAPEARLSWTLTALRRFQIQAFYPAHCTGMKAVAALWHHFPGQCFPCACGTTLTFGWYQSQ